MIKVGEKIPNVNFTIFQDHKIKKISSSELFDNQTVVLFAVPGAFTPTCSEQHLPGYVSNQYEFKQHGVNLIACVSVNDAFVMRAWAKDQDIVNEVMMLADGNGDFAKAVGMQIDLSKFDLGMRSKRYSMLIENGIVKSLHVEKDGGLKVSDAETMLRDLEGG